MQIRFPYESKHSAIFGQVLRPVVPVNIWSPLFKTWLSYTFIVDTGSDYTLMPQVLSLHFGVNIKLDCTKFEAKGIGGTETVYFFKKGLKLQIGNWVKLVPLGFLNRDDVPPLLGRKGCLDNLAICFENFETIITTK